MAVVRWDPGRELMSLQGEMNRMFNSFFDTGDGNGGQSAQRRWMPAMDVIEAADDFVIRLDLPGMEENDIDIEVQDNTLAITGERRAHTEGEGEGWFRRERAYGRFARTLQLPEGVDPDAVSASFDRGVLEVHVPKPEQRKPRKVSIGGSAAIEGSESRSGG